MEIKGLMFVRHIGNKSILLAVIEKPEDLQDEAQHAFIGNVEGGVLSIQTVRGAVVDIKDRAKGHTPDSLLLQPVWQI